MSTFNFICIIKEANRVTSSKYPLAIVNHLLDVLGVKIGMGYDIGCKFGTTVDRSPLGDKARRLQYTSLVGLFHGHAHNRLCQTAKLGTYVKGMGIEDLEGCERFFSKSNHLASSTKYATVFHRHQAITGHMQHMDRFETYQNLSKFVCDNYKQALGILSTSPAVAEAMVKQNLERDKMEEYLKEERDYLKDLKKEPAQETLEMEYQATLMKMEAAQYVSVSSPSPPRLNLLSSEKNSTPQSASSSTVTQLP